MCSASKCPVVTLFNMLKAYSQISYRGRSQKFYNVKFLHLFVALLQEAHFPKGINQKSFQSEIRAIFFINCHWQELI